MTLEEMQQTTLDYWLTYHRRAAVRLGKGTLQEQAMACARLTRSAMEDLMAIGVDEATAWTECRNLYCLAPPPKLDRLQTAQ